MIGIIKNLRSDEEFIRFIRFANAQVVTGILQFTFEFTKLRFLFFLRLDGGVSGF